MPVLNVNIRSTDLYVESLKLHSSYCISHMHINFVLTRTVETPHKLTQLFLFHSIHAHSANILCLRLTDKQGSPEMERDCGLLHLYLFCVFMVSVRCWLIQGNNLSRKSCDRVPWPSMFLRTISPSFAFGKFWFKCKVRPLKVFSACTFSVTHIDITQLDGTRFSLSHLAPIVGLPGSCAHGAWQTPQAPGATRQPGRRA